MTRAKADRRLGGRLQPHFDSLEARLALSGSGFGTGVADNISDQVGGVSISTTLSVVSTTPATSSILSSSPSTILVTFDRPLDPISVNNGDFVLVHVGANGSTTPLNTGESRIDEVLDSSDLTGSRILLTLSKPLLNGHYQLLLEGDSQLQGGDGSSLATIGSNSVLSGFTVGRASSGSANAVYLGTIASSELIRPGVLDLSSNLSTVDYYNLTLAPGHHWRLGLEITTAGLSQALNSTLSLFDSSGRRISTDSEGLDGGPGNPYLFQGLEPGTYLVGVSARGNIPDSSGIYNPSQTILPTAGASEIGGAFLLHAVADQSDQPTQVLGVRLDHFDPLSTEPTGLTLQFSGAIQVTPLLTSGTPSVMLVDQSGRNWSLTPGHYQGTLGQLSFIFDQPLPAGNYTLELSGTNELIDLAGRPPVNPSMPTGVLANFNVLAGSRVSTDLGPLLPMIARDGLNSTINIAPNSSITRQFSVLGGGVYAISGVGGANGVGYTLTDERGDILSVGVQSSPGDKVDLIFKPGLYTLTLTNPGSTKVQLPISIRENQVVFSQLLQSGVAQGSAFSLRLVTPDPNFGSVAALASPSLLGYAGPAASGGAKDSTSSVTPIVGQNTPSSPSVAGILYSLAPVGRPGSQSNQISVVGPSSPTGAIALASNSPGLAASLIAAPVERRSGAKHGLEVIPVDPEIQVGDAAFLRRGSTLDAGALARSPGSRVADERSLDDADWIGRMVSNAFHWLGRSPAVSKEFVEFDPASLVAASAEESDLSTEEPQTQTADLSSPIVVGTVLTSIAYQFRHKLLHRLGSKSKFGSMSKLRQRPTFSGPHFRPKSKVKTHES